MMKILLHILVVLIIVLNGHHADAIDNKKKPNIIFIFADDQAYNTIHALGNKEIKTPNLDKLVESGTTFTHNYNMGAWAGAVCVASRTMLNTGRSVWRAKELNTVFQKEDSLAITQTWGNLLKQAGYDTYMTGKWHIQADIDKCFDYIGTKRYGMPKQTKAGYNRPMDENDKNWLPWDAKHGGYWQGGQHWSEVVGDESIDFIEQAKGREHPFFMYVAFNAPHDPRQSPKEYVDMYPLDKISVPDNYQPLYPEKDDIGCGKNLRDEKLAPFPRTEYAVKVNRQEYYAIITHMDHQIGRILDALEKSGQKDDTYIFYTADHGLACGEHGLLGKQNMYDHSMRSPLIVIGPDVPEGKRKEVDVYLQDIMPSTLEIAGLEKPAYVEFNSLMPLITNRRKKGNYDAIYGSYKELQRMVRADDYKLIVYPKAQKVKLFNLKKDPLEMKNLASNQKYQKKIKELFGQLLQLQQEMDDALDLTAVFPELLN
ncbi:sulfatase-like hydrolase/transferase [Carboxylicivirga marina]|uniref:Sulfatase-like hydrolase/transferase n=1 Tax=Carboxylicivirga marina TaxID=2800988 RepID=A0ABS1HNG4_9BACT|nr:sulfatase-like hydrolase/transferase [Carboxylicivirga marina]MBK3519228.1 sulfatase-like hydrolase/transferase [Carboxylicivirga marina]